MDRREGTPSYLPIAIGTLKLKAGLGELIPAIPPKEKGAMKGKKKDVSPGDISFRPNTISTYRKLAANRGKIESENLNA